MSTSEEIFQDAVALPPDVRAELAERLIASLANEVSSEITSAQVAEVQRRVAQLFATTDDDHRWELIDDNWLNEFPGS